MWRMLLWKEWRGQRRLLVIVSAGGFLLTVLACVLAGEPVAWTMGIVVGSAALHVARADSATALPKLRKFIRSSGTHKSTTTKNVDPASWRILTLS